jgi:hypothetical protein
LEVILEVFVTRVPPFPTLFKCIARTILVPLVTFGHVPRVVEI